MGERDKERVPLTKEELLLQLKKQIHLIFKSIKEFDNGDVLEALNLATRVRTLVHHNDYLSLLAHLGKKEIQYLNTSDDFDPSNSSRHLGLVEVNLDDSGVTVIPNLYRKTETTNRKQSFIEWWECIVIVDEKGNQFTRRDIVTNIADTDGGVHADAKLDKLYYELTRSNSLGVKVFKNGVEIDFNQSIVLISLRQITHELLITLSEEFSDFFTTYDLNYESKFNGWKFQKAVVYIGDAVQQMFQLQKKMDEINNDISKYIEEKDLEKLIPIITQLIEETYSCGPIEARNQLGIELYRWANQLTEIGKRKKGIETNKLYDFSFKLYSESSKYVNKSNFYCYWGSALCSYSKIIGTDEAKHLLEQSFEKYEKSLNINSSYYHALYRWGKALIMYGTQIDSQEAREIWSDSIEKSLKAETVRSGSGAFNIAIAYSLLGEIKLAMAWLEKAYELDDKVTSDRIINEENLESLFETEGFKEFIRKCV